MSAIPFSQFLTDYKFLSAVMRRPGLLIALWKDTAENQVCLVAEYSNLEKSKRDAIFADFLTSYVPTYCVRLLHYTGKKSPSERNLVLIFEHCQTMSDFMIDQRSGTLKSLSIREIVYMFRQVVAALNHFHVHGVFHGDIREETLFIDDQNQVKLLRLPHFPTNVALVREKRMASEHKEANAVLLPPELEAIAASASDLALISVSQMQQNDIYCLGLLCTRLLNPVLFLKALSSEDGKADINSLMTLIDSLEPHLGQEFGGALRKCLSLNPLERIISKAFLKNQPDVSASSLFDWDEKVVEAECSPLDDSSPENLEQELLSQEHKSEKNPQENSEQHYSMSVEGNLKDKLFSLAQEKIGQFGKSEGGLMKAIKIPLQVSTFKSSIMKGLNPIESIKSKAEEILHPGSSQRHTRHAERKVTKEPTKTDPAVLNKLKLKCVNQLESEFFSKIPSESSLNKTLGRTYFNLKILANTKDLQSKLPSPFMNISRTLGFIQYPSGDLYYGFVRELCREDVGIHFYSNGEVFHGEFRKNSISGHGTHFYLNGDVLLGTYQEERLHGHAVLFMRNTNQLLECKFEEGKLVDKVEVEAENDMPNIKDFFSERFLQSEVVLAVKSYLESIENSEKRKLQGKFMDQIETLVQSSSKKTPLKEGRSKNEALLLTKEELAQFNQAENKQREFFNGYYFDLISCSDTKAQRTKHLSNKKPMGLKKRTSQERVERFYEEIKGNYRDNFDSEEISADNLSGKTDNKRRNFEPIREDRYINHDGDLDLVERSHKRKAIKKQESPTKTETPERWNGVSPHKPAVHSNLKAVRFTRDHIEEVGEASEQSSNQVLVNQIDEQRNRLKNVLDKIESADEEPVMQQEEAAYREPEEPSEVKEGGYLEFLKRTVIRPSQGKTSDWNSLIDGDEPAPENLPRETEDGFKQVCWPSGDRFYGEFESGRAHGKGIYYCADGWSVQGVWHRGRLSEVS
jgi:serine/threonine protein kinase